MSTYDKVPLERLNFGIVLNDLPEESIRKDVELSGWILGKATLEEAKECSEQLRKYNSLDFLGLPRQEYKITLKENGVHLEPLTDPKHWRYTVVRPQAEDKLNGAKLAEAFRISDADLCVELWCVIKQPNSHSPEKSIGGHPAQCVQYLGRSLPEESLIPLDTNHLSEVVSLRAQFDDKKFPSIVKAIEMFRALDVNPPSSVKMLGYFGIIESLLSHAPQPNDSANSISQQLKRNLVLLNNRINKTRALGFDEFRTPKAETIISKLYDYRSAIAHGGDEISKIRELIKIHKGFEKTPDGLWPDRFLRRLTKRILVHALREPQLVIDLKG
jgi:hypothetical protein